MPAIAGFDGMTVFEASQKIGIREWRLRRLYERGLIPPPPKFGPYRVIREGDLPAIIEAARAAGYLPAEGGD